MTHVEIKSKFTEALISLRQKVLSLPVLKIEGDVVAELRRELLADSKILPDECESPKINE